MEKERGEKRGEKEIERSERTTERSEQHRKSKMNIIHKTNK